MNPKTELLYPELCYRIQGWVFEVYRELGSGFLERIYHRALLRELSKRGIEARTQKPRLVKYKGQLVGHFYPDIIVEEKIILELKAQPTLHPSTQAQVRY